MPRFAANLHYLFTELPFLDRFEAAAAAGFKAVEFQVPYDYPATELSAQLRHHQLQMVLFDAPMGDWARGDRGIAAVPGREREFRDELGYPGWVGCEYRPRADTWGGLSWAAKYGIRAAQVANRK